VSRDIQGAKFWWAYPFLKDEESQRAVKKGMGKKNTMFVHAEQLLLLLHQSVQV
jgi:hypothetical protein